MNNTIKTIKERVSLRKYDDKDIKKEHLDKILESAMKAPTAGNQMLYSIILIRNQDTKDALSKSCDNQPFIADAPLLMLFVADHQKWFDYYIKNKVKEYSVKAGIKFEAPQESDLFLACEDAMIAAQNAVIAAESLGIGSCYIGDILENYEYHKDLLNLPDWAFPISLITFGYYPPDYHRVHRKRFDKKFVVFDEKYKRLSDEELDEMYGDLEKFYVKSNKYEADNYAQMFYSRKTGADFSKEMARSVRVALKKWTGELL